MQSSNANNDADKKSVIVDIRDYAHYNYSHPKTAFHLTQQSYPDFLANHDFDDEIMVICYHGISSQKVAQTLVMQGFEKVYNVIGGFEAWQKAQLPIETPY
ncbi:thiosulfate sulfurtransferase [Phocoenobacter uteri]|nr:thiosulfate sulfurtransferase [Phocoenobacter uteri]